MVKKYCLKKDYIPITYVVCEECYSYITSPHLKTCYFTDLTQFLSRMELQHQLDELCSLFGNIAVRRKIKQKWKTLHKQCDKLIKRLEALGSNKDMNDDTNTAPPAPPNHQPQEVELKCCNCGEVGCLRDCWGFHGLKRK